MDRPIPLDRIDPVRFWARTTSGPQPDPELYPTLTQPCLDTTYRRTPGGYGRVAIGSPQQEFKAHRIAFELTHGSGSTTGQLVLHHCDRPACVEPTHLYVGDHADNMADRRDRGRAPAPPEGFVRRGEDHRSAKLTPAQVTEIRRRYDQGGRARGLQRRLAEEFGVRHEAIFFIVHPEHPQATWTHLPWPDPPPS